jgi:hypothetical protein
MAGRPSRVALTVSVPDELPARPRPGRDHAPAGELLHEHISEA